MTGGGDVSGASVDEAHPEGTYNLLLADGDERSAALKLLALDAAACGPFVATGGAAGSSDKAGGVAASARKEAGRSAALDRLLQDVKVNGIPVRDDVRAAWPEALPTAGVFECNFTRVRGVHAMPVLDGKKMRAVEREFERSTCTDDTKVRTLSMLAPYSYLYASQVSRLLRYIGTGDQLVQIACVLMLRCIDLEDGGSDAILSALDKRTAHFVLTALGDHGCFKGVNPTGHYALHLSQPVHRHLAARLKDCAIEEGPSCLTWRNIMCACHAYVCLLRRVGVI